MKLKCIENVKCFKKFDGFWIGIKTIIINCFLKFNQMISGNRKWRLKIPYVATATTTEFKSEKNLIS